ncbi:winged helix-turn-helix domain-containing protein [Kovacikia minuta]|uniref:winged helix-turn-helix domain-containing protein n=1 Tax=Kovacikia minuta TaxID=2931930 RepID=UPI001CEC6ADF|nr:response regulator transcription factor [Kovacikia minuta]
MLQTIPQINTNDRVHKTAVQSTSHIPLVENDRQLAQLIVQELSYEGYQISSVEDVIEKLIARVRVHLGQGEKLTHILQFEQLILDRKAHQVFYCHREIELTAKEFDLLEYLMRHPNQVLTRDQILDGVWGYESLVSSNVVEVYIRYLRIKLEAHGAKQFIHTVRSVGYVLRIKQHQNATASSKPDQHQYSHLNQLANSIKAS